MGEVKYEEPMKRLYNFRVSEEEWDMIKFLRGKKVKLPLALREYIREVYESEMDKGRDIDKDVYGL